MASQTPITSVNFCANVPLDNRYANTLYFENRNIQQAYFNGKVVAQMGGATYQRQNRYIATAVDIETLDGCNYLFFKNNEFENRVYYCFITRVEYVNNNTSHVYFEIDVMQTYLLDCTFRQCFIERGHSADDTIGANQVPEGLETGEYTNLDMTHTSAIEPMVICVAASVDEEGEPVSGGYYSLVYSGVKINVFETPAEVDEYLKALTEANRADAIVNIFMMPHTFQAASGTSPKRNSFIISKPYSSISGYTPKNKKLFCWPYNVLHVTNGEGMSADYRYEFFSTSQCTFNVYGCMSCAPQAICVPTNYKNILQNWDEKISLDGWAQCAYTIDSYKAWLAQNANVIAWQDNTAAMRQRNTEFANARSRDSTVLEVLGSAAQYGAMGAAAGSMAVPGVGTGIGAAVGGALGLGRSLMNAYYESGQSTINVQNTQSVIDGILAVREDHATTPPQAYGGGSSTVMQGLGLKTFFIYRKQIRAEFAKIIDDYFTLYGYAQHVVARPNLFARSRFTYTKTKGCNAQANIPVWAVKSITDIMDKGITFWHDHDGVGNYELANTPNGNGDY